LRGSKAILPDRFSTQSTEKTINLVWAGKALSISSIQFLSLKESEAIFPDPIEGSQALQIRSQVKKKEEPPRSPRGGGCLPPGESARSRVRSRVRFVERGLAPGALSPGPAHLQRLPQREPRVDRIAGVESIAGSRSDRRNIKKKTIACRAPGARPFLPSSATRLIARLARPAPWPYRSARSFCLGRARSEIFFSLAGRPTGTGAGTHATPGNYRPRYTTEGVCPRAHLVLAISQHLSYLCFATVWFHICVQISA
jgi:hypothetical protein